MILKNTQIPENISNYVQRLYYDMLAYEILVKETMRESEFIYTTENYQLCVDQYKNAFKAYNLAIQELGQMYYPEAQGNYKTTVNFIKSTVTFETTSNCICCKTEP